ncbi:MAG: tetratricopeptide repeat protein [Roseobacter sp.]|jgi:tetratricopeptide (TPR) repeat protein|nr:tetratricopeptide repeat protein [Roseobacter sp.]
MLKDRYDNTLSTTSQAARDGYVAALDLMLEGQAGICAGFERTLEADPRFSLAWVGLARAHQYAGDMAATQAALAEARAVSDGVTAREASHIAAMDLMMSGRLVEAYAAIRTHVEAYPRDAMIAQTCSSVFGLIGFSGQPGREAEMLAFNASLLPHYGDDWWAISQYAFALCETGNLARADATIDHAMALNPRNAHGAHVRSHVSYETGDTDGGRAYLAQWLGGYDRAGVMFTHLNWHEALWALEQGDIDAMWARVDAAVSPAAEAGAPPINTLTDTASILHRATMSGVAVAPERWVQVSDYAQKAFPKTGNAFVDVHAALAHAMAGRAAALEEIIAHPAGPAADLVPGLAQGFAAVARRDWAAAAGHLTDAMADLARIGGSRAQRDMVEQTLLTAMVAQGKSDEARVLAALRRPLLADKLAA